jgi:predicted transcriptional regulator
MAEVLGEAVLELSTDSTKLDRGLKISRKQVGVAMAGIGAAILGAAALSVKSFASMGDEVQKMALRTGFSTEAISELAHALQISGSDIKGFENGIKRMATFILDAQDGLSSSTDALDRLGVSVEELQGLSPEQAFQLLSNAVAEVPGEIEKAALAQDVFGRAGTRLLPLLAGGADGIARLREEAHDLGIVFDQEAANQAAELTDAMARLKLSFKGIVLQVGSSLAPMLTSFADTVTSVVKPIIGWAKEHPFLTKILVVAATAIGAITAAIGSLLLILPPLIMGIRTLGITMRVATTAGVVGLVITALTVLATVVLPMVIRNWDKIWNAIKTTTENVVNFIIKLINGYTFVHRNALALLLEGVQAVAKFIPGLGQVGAALQIAIDRLRQGLPEIDIAADSVKALGDQVEATAVALPEKLRTVAEAVAATGTIINGTFVETAAVLADTTEDWRRDYDSRVATAKFAADTIALDNKLLMERIAEQNRTMHSTSLEDLDDYLGDWQAAEAAAALVRQAAQASADELIKATAEELARHNLEILEKRLQDEDDARASLAAGWSQYTDRTLVDLRAAGISRGDILDEWAEKTGEHVSVIAELLQQQGVGVNDLVGIWEMAEDRVSLSMENMGKDAVDMVDTINKALKGEVEAERGKSNRQKAMDSFNVWAGGMRDQIQRTFAKASQRDAAGMTAGADRARQSAIALQGEVDRRRAAAQAMATGGIVTGPTLAMLGESGPEAVVPLNRGGAGGMGATNIHFHGDVYGMEDFERKVAGVAVRQQRRGAAA